MQTDLRNRLYRRSWHHVPYLAEIISAYLEILEALISTSLVRGVRTAEGLGFFWGLEQDVDIFVLEEGDGIRRGLDLKRV